MTAAIGRDTCYRCFRPLGSCLCAVIPEVKNRTPLLILQHPRERTHPFNTVRIVALALSNCELVVDHAHRVSQDPGLLGSLAGCGLLYPRPGARDITTLPAAERPRKLLVIDGTWHQAKALYREVPVLHDLPHFTLPSGLRSAFEIRQQPAEYCLSTLEAIVFALRALEPETEGLDKLLHAFGDMQRQQQRLMASFAALAPPGATARQRKRKRPAQSRAIPRAFLESYGSLVVAYAESWLDPSGSGERVLLCFAALRPATGERFFRVLEHDIGAAKSAHLGLDQQLEHVSLERFRADWASFSRPGDLLASWNSSTLELMRTATGGPCPGLTLKGAYYNLRRFRGSLETISKLEGLHGTSAEVGPTRAQQRLARAHELAEFLHRQGSVQQ
ncbi:MAG: hypothetical protein RL685_2593 [Pseudomonadota bacterium]